MKAQLLVPAAGAGTRLGRGVPKALIPLAGRPLLVRTLDRFDGLGLLEGAVITIPPDFRNAFRGALYSAFPEHDLRLVDGGAERQASVSLGLEALDADTEIVVIHDAARPFVSPESVRASIEAAAEFGAATVAVPSIDTVLEADSAGLLVHTPDRSRLWACQTPQTFRVQSIRAAHEAALRQGFAATDDATLVSRVGGAVRLVMGSPLNFKLTTPTDWALAECVIREGLACTG